MSGMAAHHWTEAHAWNGARGYHVSHQDVASEDFPLDTLAEEVADPAIGGAFCWDGENEGGWMFMFSGQTAEQEALTAHNAAWWFTCGIGSARYRRSPDVRPPDHEAEDADGRVWSVYLMPNDEEMWAAHDRLVAFHRRGA